MKKLSLLFLLLFSSFLLVACGGDGDVDEDPIVPTSYTVTFNSDGGSTVASQTVEEGELLVDPSDPTKTMYIFMNWYETEGVIFDFTQPVTGDINLTALWELDLENLTDEAKVNFDIAEYESMMLSSDYLIYMPYKIQDYYFLKSWGLFQNIF